MGGGGGRGEGGGGGAGGANDARKLKRNADLSNHRKSTGRNVLFLLRRYHLSVPPPPFFVALI